jgi:hypothetical protein
MKRIFFVFFFVLGVIFFLLILISIYLYVADPLNLKPLFMSGEQEVSSLVEEIENEDGGEEQDVVVDKNPALNPAQERALEAMKIDPAQVPTSITPEQEACFVGIIGQVRVDEIKAGAVPSAVEIFRARECL